MPALLTKTEEMEAFMGRLDIRNDSVEIILVIVFQFFFNLRDAERRNGAKYCFCFDFERKENMNSHATFIGRVFPFSLISVEIDEIVSF